MPKSYQDGLISAAHCVFEAIPLVIFRPTRKFLYNRGDERAGGKAA
jgi:hypothetical protein